MISLGSTSTKFSIDFTIFVMSCVSVRASVSLRNPRHQPWAASDIPGLRCSDHYCHIGIDPGRSHVVSRCALVDDLELVLWRLLLTFARHAIVLSRAAAPARLRLLMEGRCRSIIQPWALMKAPLKDCSTDVVGILGRSSRRGHRENQQTLAARNRNREFKFPDASKGFPVLFGPRRLPKIG